jgi:hypothetical protein
VLVDEPVRDPGFIVHEPEGKPLNATLPVARTQVGCVTVPGTGAVGEGGWLFITTFSEDVEVQPSALLIINE